MCEIRTLKIAKIINNSSSVKYRNVCGKKNVHFFFNVSSIPAFPLLYRHLVIDLQCVSYIYKLQIKKVKTAQELELPVATQPFICILL